MANYIFIGIAFVIAVFITGFLIGKRHGQKVANPADKLRGVF
jgi:hypothetical protein